MTVSAMHTAFKILVDKTDSLNYAGFEPEEIDLWLNMAQERLVKTRYGGNNVYRKGFEESEKRTDDLRTIVRQESSFPLPPQATNKPNGQFVVLPTSPTPYWFSIEEDAVLSYTDCNNVTQTKIVPVKAITHDQYNRIIHDPFNRPNEDEVVRLMTEGYLEVIAPATATVTSFNIRYVRKPAIIDLVNSVDCELPDQMHQEVVNNASNMALENIESIRYRSNTVELSKEE